MININSGITFGFSACAILISIITWKKNNKAISTIAEKTLNKLFFEEIYFKDMTTELPLALSNIQFDEGHLSANCNNADKIVVELLNKSQFYRYFEQDFYDIIKLHLVELDDILISRPADNVNRYALENYKIKLADSTHKFYAALKIYYSGI